jgi:hypothetical protein
LAHRADEQVLACTFVRFTRSPLTEPPRETAGKVSVMPVTQPHGLPRDSLLAAFVLRTPATKISLSWSNLSRWKCTWAPSSVSRARKRSFQGWDSWDSRVRDHTRQRCFALVLNPKPAARSPDNIADDPIGEVRRIWYDGFVAWLSSFGFLLDEKAARRRHGLP